MKTLGRLVYGFATHLFEGFVLRTVWGWFIVPLGVVALPYWTAVIIVVTVGWLVMQLPVTSTDWTTVKSDVANGSEKGHEASLLRATTYLLASGQLLVMAWLIHLIAK